MGKYLPPTPFTKEKLQKASYLRQFGNLHFLQTHYFASPPHDGFTFYGLSTISYASGLSTHYIVAIFITKIKKIVD